MPFLSVTYVIDEKLARERRGITLKILNIVSSTTTRFQSVSIHTYVIEKLESRTVLGF